MSEEIAEAIPGAVLVVLPDGGPRVTGPNCQALTDQPVLEAGPGTHPPFPDHRPVLPGRSRVRRLGADVQWLAGALLLAGVLAQSSGLFLHMEPVRKAAARSARR